MFEDVTQYVQEAYVALGLAYEDGAPKDEMVLVLPASVAPLGVGGPDRMWGVPVVFEGNEVAARRSGGTPDGSKTWASYYRVPIEPHVCEVCGEIVHLRSADLVSVWATVHLAVEHGAVV